ncbi:hypothetical protein GGR56DRAFT_686869 [Xylariaceae sp. FL0804]|nr:hypothetical protein GGR56DRAFT_686869 [Xylariaceae sp. FL0804]
MAARPRPSLWSRQQQEVLPRCRVTPISAEGVAESLAIIRRHACHFAVRSGGHAPFAGASVPQGGVAIDLGRLTGLTLLDDGVHVRVGSGNTWSEVYRYLEQFGLSASGSRNGDVGVGGSIIGGGISFFNNYRGWACDNVAAFELVLPNSTITHIDQDANHELYFALRGGGGNFGIVTEYTIEAFRQGPVWHVGEVYPLDDAFEVFDELERGANQPDPDQMTLVSVTLFGGGHFPITRKTVHRRPDRSEPESKLMSARGHVASRGEAPLSVVAQEMADLNPRGSCQEFASLTVKNSIMANLSILRIVFEESEKIRDVPGVSVSIVFNPLTQDAIRLMGRKGGNVFGIKAADGPLTVINVNTKWSDIRDEERMGGFVQRLVERATLAARELDLHHPFIFQNHAGKQQDVFGSLPAKNAQRLVALQEQVDPMAIMTTLQPGYFRLKGITSSSPRQQDRDEL